MSQTWRSCSSCKTDIAQGASYYTCNVSTCNSKRTGYVFCSVPCFERHLPGARHKEAYAVEETAPMQAPVTSNSTSTDVTTPRRRIITGARGGAAPSKIQQGPPKEILIVASKLKAYVNAKSDMNTSANVMERLSDLVRLMCDDAIDEARAQGRRTLMDRDFKRRY